MVIKLLQSLKKDVSIKMLLHQRMPQWEKARDSSTLHASDLMKELEFCPREYALLDSTGAKKKDQFIGTAQRATFAHGKDMESRLRNEWLRDIIVGLWRCGVCNYLHNTFGKAPKDKCPKCGWGHQWQYEEVRFLSPHSGISGGIDGIIDVGESKHRLLEIKSMDKDAFKELVGPLAEHRFRTSLYLKLVEDSGPPLINRLNTKKAHILYVSKSFGFKDPTLEKANIKDSPFSPFKEYVIERDDSLLEPALSKAKALHYFRETEGKKGLPCGICSNALTKRAQKCDAKQFCWTGKFTATISWTENGVIKHPGKILPQQ